MIDRHTGKDRWIDRQDRQTDAADKEIDRQSFREADSFSDRQKILQGDGETDRESFRESLSDRELILWTNRQTVLPRDRKFSRQTVLPKDRQSFQKTDSPFTRQTVLQRDRQSFRDTALQTDRQPDVERRTLLFEGIQLVQVNVLATERISLFQVFTLHFTPVMTFYKDFLVSFRARKMFYTVTFP